MWETASLPAHGVHSLKTTDGPAGVRGATWVDGSYTTYIPCGISLAATFNPALIEQVGVVLGAETKAKHAHVLLAPTMNISRSPFGGRNFENFGEDPYLTGIMSTSYISGVQSQGVGACMKHYVGNDQETRRFNMNEKIDERTLREIYLRPFEMALKADPWTVMTAYPKINGEHADTNRHLLVDILRGEWGFDRLVMSDWGGLNDTVKSIVASTDLEMPGPSLRYGQALAVAVRSGAVSEEKHVDPCVLRVLRLSQKAGLLRVPLMARAQSQDDTEDSSKQRPAQAKEEASDRPEFRQTAREAAAEGIVLLKNNDMLPLQPEKINSIAILGPNAKNPTTGGTGSAIVNPYYTTNPYDSITKMVRSVAPDVKFTFEQGISTYLQPPLIGDMLRRPGDGLPGLEVDFYEGHEFNGDVVASSLWRNSLVYLMSDGDMPETLREGKGCYRAYGALRPHTSGDYTMSLSSTGKAKLFLDGQLIIDNSNWTKISGNFMNCGSEEVFITQRLEAGREYELRIDNIIVPPPIVPHDNTLFHKISGVRVGMALRHDEAAMFNAAVTAARSSDVAILVVGHNNDTEREGSDRSSLSLPGRTDELVSAVCEANPQTVVVTQSACAIAMPWAGKAAAVVHAWYQGQENGNALADILFGAVNPSGKLPLTFPHRKEDHGSHAWFPGDPVTDMAEYGEGVLVGYRWLDYHGIEPLWPFGYGLSYTSFAISNVAVSGVIAANGAQAAVCTAAVSNTGDRRGSAVVQCYVSSSPAIRDKGLVCTPKALAGFQKAGLDPGASTTVQISLDYTSIRWYDEANSRWAVDKGVYTCYVGNSSRDIVAEVAFEVV